MKKIITDTKFPIKIWTNDIDENSILQLKNIANMPFIHSHVAAMPDVHLGKGATVGSVIATHKAIIPAAVGVDLGCGMCAIKTSLVASDLPDNLLNLRCKIEELVPHGRTDNGGRNDKGRHQSTLPQIVNEKMSQLKTGLDIIVAKHNKLEKSANNCIGQLGTLGTGNHFIEICLDENQAVWIMLHSGSRGIGNAIGNYFIEKAQEDMRTFFINLPDKDLAYLPEGTQNFNDYIEAVDWAQQFASKNREVMMNLVIKAIQIELKIDFDTTLMAINCHHNYVNKERHFGANVFVTRKGAVSAKEGEYGIIPGSMGAKSFIVRGKGNRDSFCSCSHGAGRKFSRNEAKRQYNVEDLKNQTFGVECRKDADVIDEIPSAYKDIDIVMQNQSDLVEIVYTLKQILCVKG